MTQFCFVCFVWTEQRKVLGSSLWKQIFCHRIIRIKQTYIFSRIILLGSNTSESEIRFRVLAIKKMNRQQQSTELWPDGVIAEWRNRSGLKWKFFFSASAPKVSELRPTLTVNEGANIKLKCKISGSPTPEVTWLKNGLPLRPNFRFSVKTKK